MMQSMASGVAVAVTAGVAAAGSTPLVIDDFSTSFSIATNINDTSGANVGSFSPNINQTAVRFFGAADSGNLDLLVEIVGTPNAGQVGLAGAGLAFNDYSQGSDRDPFVLNYQFVQTGTNTGVAIDELSVGLKDLDEHRGTGQIGEENILVDGSANNVTSVETPSGVDVVFGNLQDNGNQYAALGLNNSDPFDFKLDPNSQDDDAVINFANLTDGSFSLVFSNEAGGSELSGGFNLVGGAQIDTSGFTSTQVIPLPHPAAMAAAGLAGIAVVRRRR